jgi:hypothetical protein
MYTFTVCTHCVEYFIHVRRRPLGLNSTFHAINIGVMQGPKHNFFSLYFFTSLTRKICFLCTRIDFPNLVIILYSTQLYTVYIYDLYLSKGVNTENNVEGKILKNI